ncbi:MAG: UbiA-like polyprenyltransferase [Gaiellales bacterium]
MSAVAAPLPLRLARLVKLEHTVFALPFALIGALLASGGSPGWANVGWIVAAMAGARTLAMALNRLVDAELDARNPRTAVRELPSGALTRVQVAVLCLAAVALYVLSTWQLNAAVRWLWPIPVVLFVVYPYLKRFTWLCHLWLGASLGLAPVGAWAAVAGTFPLESWAIGGAVTLWVAGFDLFYALLDLEHDREAGLSSWATRFGVRGVFRGAVVLHVGTVALLVAAGIGLELGLWYFLGVTAVAGLLAYEHSLVSPDDLRRLNTAFFTVNGVISVVLLCFVILETA